MTFAVSSIVAAGFAGTVVAAAVVSAVVSDCDSCGAPQPQSSIHAASDIHNIDLMSLDKSITFYIFSILQKFAISFLVPALSKAISSRVSFPIFSAVMIMPLPNSL